MSGEERERTHSLDAVCATHSVLLGPPGCPCGGYHGSCHVECPGDRCSGAS